MTDYIVTWTSGPYEADTPEVAARMARMDQRALGSTAGVYAVSSDFSTAVLDLTALDVAVHGDELIRRTQLIEALIEDWRDTLTSEPWQAEAILKNGFPGYEYMTTAELEKQAADAGLCDEDQS